MEPPIPVKAGSTRPLSPRTVLRSAAMDLHRTNWETLHRLRQRFLDAKAGAGAYWQNEDDLAHYHAYFAARIGWKWDSALEEALRLGFAPAGRQLFDWGCGSGIASLRMLARFGTENYDRVTLWDHSTLACQFARKTILAAHPTLEVTIANRPDEIPDAQQTTVLVSHTLNELTEEARSRQVAQFREAAQILWVEPGDYHSSRLLATQREALRDDFDILAPCPHHARCPMLDGAHLRHWCHFFGSPSPEAFTDSSWAQFAQMMEIDLRSLPYSYLILNHKRLASPAPKEIASCARLIGRPEQHKGYSRLLSCSAQGLQELELQKRDAKDLWKSLKKEKDGSLYQWSKIEDARIRSGAPVTEI